MVNNRDQNKKTPNQSGEILGFNDDLIIEIVLRLPVSSVLRFKSVSKHWRFLLSHQPFTRLYNNGTISPGLFIEDDYIPFDVENQSAPRFRYLDFEPEYRGIKIIQSCNGLLLCCSKDRKKRECKYYVFNPTTNQFAQIPPVLGGRRVRKTICFMGLAFHQTDCVHYKVLCFHYNCSELLFGIQIYSSDTGKWKISDQSFYSPGFSDFCFCIGGVYWNKAIHWISSCGKLSYWKVDTEELKSMPLPVVLGTPAYESYFGESRGHLHLVSGYGNLLHLKVYEMLNDHSGWFIKYRMELVKLLKIHPPTYCFQVLDLVRGEGDEFFMAILIGNKIIRCNFRRNSFKQIFSLGFYGPIYNSKVHRYVETLVPF